MIVTEQLAACAAEIGPLTNRVSFVVGDDLGTGPAADRSICTARQSPPEIHLVPSGSPARLAAEFAAAGFVVSTRHHTHDTWMSSHGTAVHVAAESNEPESDWAVASEYATLLTSTLTVGTGGTTASIRVAATTAQLAFLGSVHRLNGWSLVSSFPGEQFVRMILAGVVRRELVASAPAELRAIISRNASHVARDPALGFLLHRLVRGARAHGSARAIALPAIEALIAA